MKIFFGGNITMFNADYLKFALTGFFHDAVESDAYEYDQGEVDALLEEIDFDALAQALRNRMQTIFSYTTQGNQRKSFNYRSSKLFEQQGVLIYEDFDRSSADAAVADRTYELWLLEDMSIVAVSRVTVDYDDGAYLTAYRESLGEPWDSAIDIDLTDLTGGFMDMCAEVYENETPVYELL